MLLEPLRKWLQDQRDRWITDTGMLDEAELLEIDGLQGEYCKDFPVKALRHEALKQWMLF